MAREHKRWAMRARARLMVDLGNRCAECESLYDLTFDCIVSLGHVHHSMDASARMCFYHKQHREGNLQILCRRCNGKKGYYERLAHQAILDKGPF